MTILGNGQVGKVARGTGVYNSNESKRKSRVSSLLALYCVGSNPTSSTKRILKNS